MEESRQHPERRRYLRIPVVLKIKFRCFEDLERMINAKALNISKRGMFICTEKTPTIGRRVEIEMLGRDGEPVKIKGTVRSFSSFDGHPHGIGIEFDQLEGAAAEAVEYIVETAARAKEEKPDEDAS
jgi:c-di-GMP-binding flagellar brake protein YcgR